jgi:hypothetical protein
MVRESAAGLDLVLAVDEQANGQTTDQFQELARLMEIHQFFS